MWRFMQEQLSAWDVKKGALSEEDEALLEKIWLDPTTEAVNRQLEKYALV
jgi:hypothetical protein